MKAKIIRALLISLLRADGQPMPEDSLIEAAQLVCRPADPDAAEVIDQMKNLMSEGYISGVTEEATRERFYNLTLKGKDKARQLR